ncbi:hypothetical protein V4C85_25855 [Ralstonia solanacearum]|uniref:hypothetical protein n=1 Tax=Ralstonia solanacearum TaxID=305 RepID=UPI000B182756|nr:hypothetical protein [Ralstonia solanacearum]
MAVGLCIVLLSLGSIGLVFAGFKAVYIVMSPGAIFIMTCAVLAMLGKIEKD